MNVIDTGMAEWWANIQVHIVDLRKGPDESWITSRLVLARGLSMLQFQGCEKNSIEV
jgi:hypothetical protein